MWVSIRGIVRYDGGEIGVLLISKELKCFASLEVSEESIVHSF